MSLARSVYRKKGEWDFAVYITEQDEDFVWIEMCEKEYYRGDLIMDPFIKICLEKDKGGHITQAIPKVYQSDSVFMGRTDINEKGEIFLDLKLLEIKPGELDRRLESWLDSIDRIGYVTEPDKIVFHE